MSLIALVDILAAITAVACIVVPSLWQRLSEVPAALADLFDTPPALRSTSVHPFRVRRLRAMQPIQLTAPRYRPLLDGGPTLGSPVGLAGRGRLFLFALRRLGLRMAWSLGQLRLAFAASIPWLRTRLEGLVDSRAPASRYEQLDWGIWVLRHDRRPHVTVAATVTAALTFSLLLFGHHAAPTPMPDPVLPWPGVRGVARTDAVPIGIPGWPHRTWCGVSSRPPLGRRR